MPRTILVTGGSGFIGSHVVDALSAAGYHPRIFDTRPSPWHPGVDTVVGDVLDLADLRRAVRGCAAVCHLAAAADVGIVKEEPAWSTELNAQGTLQVLEAARLEGVGRVLYASTVWVYSDVDAAEVDETTPLSPPAHLYTAGKLAGELYCRSYGELYDLQTTVLRFGIPYGPRARPAAVIPAFVARAQRGEALSIAGTGEQQRSFVYVEDLADGMVRALVPEAAGRTYNLAGEETITIRGLADLVCDVVAPVEIVHTPGRAGDLAGARILSDRAERELGWRARTPLADGVARYAAWAAEREQAVPDAARPAPAPAHAALDLVRAARAAVRAPALLAAAVMLAVLSATVATALGARDTRQGADLAVLGGALLLPIWAVGRAAWPAVALTAQRAAITGCGIVAVALLGGLSSSDSVGPHRDLLLVLVAACLSASAALHSVPRRLGVTPQRG